LEVGDVDEAGGARGGAGGLVHGGGEGCAVRDLVELLGAEVVQEDMEGEDVFDGVDGRVFGKEVVHGGVVDGADGDGASSVDFWGEMREGEVVVEGGELRMLGEDVRDVVRLGEGGEDEERRRDHRHHRRTEVVVHCEECENLRSGGVREQSGVKSEDSNTERKTGRETEVLIRIVERTGHRVSDYYGFCHSFRDSNNKLCLILPFFFSENINSGFKK